MSETWQIFIIGGAMSWIAFELRALRQELTKFVTKHDCEIDMGEHCERLTRLSEKIEKNENEIKELKAKAEIWHRED